MQRAGGPEEGRCRGGRGGVEGVVMGIMVRGDGQRTERSLGWHKGSWWKGGRCREVEQGSGAGTKYAQICK
jgi:hypothetical protein